MKTHKTRFLRNRKAKTSMGSVILIIAVIVVAYLAFTGQLNDILGNINLPFSVGGDSSGLVDVNKKVQFNCVNKYSGAALASDTLTVYDAETMGTLDTLTTASTGLIATTQNQPSGKHLYVKWNDGSNGVKWFDIIVPKMNLHDAEANTYNDVAIDGFAIGTYTSDQLKASTNATIIADADGYNKTLDGSTPVFTYTLQNTGADNTGLMDGGYDPVYGMQNQIWAEIKVSGTNWETVVISGVDRLETIGSAYYGYMRFSAEQLTKWKIGNNYVSGYTGTQSVTWSFDLSGYSGDAATLQITVYSQSDPNYASSHGGNLGPNKVTLAEQTVALED